MNLYTTAFLRDHENAGQSHRDSFPPENARIGAQKTLVTQYDAHSSPFPSLTPWKRPTVHLFTMHAYIQDAVDTGHSGPLDTTQISRSRRPPVLLSQTRGPT